MTTRLAFRPALVLALTALPAMLSAQQPGPAPRPYRPQRVLLVGNAVFQGQWEPVTTVGGLWQISVQRTRIEREELGVPLIIPPRWYVHTVLSGGSSFEPADSEKHVALTAYAQLGLVRRTDTPITAWGATVHASSTPRALGGAVRLEVMDNLGIQLGWADVRGVSGQQFMVSIDYFKKLCDDLGVGWVC